MNGNESWDIGYRLKSEYDDCLFVNEFFQLEVYVKSQGKVVYDVNISITVIVEAMNRKNTFATESLEVYSTLESDSDERGNRLVDNTLDTNQGAARFFLVLNENLVSLQVRFRIRVALNKRVREVRTGWSTLYRYRLQILQEPPETFHKDEGGVGNRMTVTVGLKDVLSGKGSSATISSAVPLTIRLSYEKGSSISSPKDQTALELYQKQSTVGIDHNADIKFRINDISRNHSGRKFRLQIIPDIQKSPESINICKCYTNSIHVYSKRSKNTKPSEAKGEGKKMRLEILENVLEQDMPIHQLPSINTSLSDCSSDKGPFSEWAKCAFTVLEGMETVQFDTELNAEGLVEAVFGCPMCRQRINPHTNKVNHLRSCRVFQSILSYKNTFERSFDLPFVVPSPRMHASYSDPLLRKSAMHPSMRKSASDPIGRVLNERILINDSRMLDTSDQNDDRVEYVLDEDLLKADVTRRETVSVWAAFDMEQNFCGLYRYEASNPSVLKFTAVGTSNIYNPEVAHSAEWLRQKLLDSIRNKKELVLQKFYYDDRAALLAVLLGSSK